MELLSGKVGRRVHDMGLTIEKELLKQDKKDRIVGMLGAAIYLVEAIMILAIWIFIKAFTM